MKNEKLVEQSEHITGLIREKKLARARQSTQHLLRSLTESVHSEAIDTPIGIDTGSLTSQILALEVNKSLDVKHQEGVDAAVHRNRLNSIITYVKKQQPTFRFTVRTSEDGFLIWKRYLPK